MPCAAVCVPEHMWKLDRPTIPAFQDDEVLWRRINKKYFKTGIVDQRAFGLKIREVPGDYLEGDSVNRSGVPDAKPADVLYSLNQSNCSGPYYAPDEHLVAVLPVNKLSQIQITVSNTTYGIVPTHTPKDCNFGHVDLLYSPGDTHPHSLVGQEDYERFRVIFTQRLAEIATNAGVIDPTVL